MRKTGGHSVRRALCDRARLHGPFVDPRDEDSAHEHMERAIKESKSQS